MGIIKRDGREVTFDPAKISHAIIRAMAQTEEGIDENLAQDVTDAVVGIMEYDEDGTVWTVDEINDLVEEQLMETPRKDVAKAFITYRMKRDEKRKQPWIMEDLQLGIWNKKYRYNNETMSEFFDRVCKGNYEVRKLMADKLFIPAGRILANRGLHAMGKKITYSNCYVSAPPEDTIESIFEVASKIARTFSYGGGIGIDISNLRPNGAVVNNAAECSSGAVSFMELYSVTTSIISQRGRR